jgi:hypothetical protein
MLFLRFMAVHGCSWLFMAKELMVLPLLTPVVCDGE